MRLNACITLSVHSLKRHVTGLQSTPVRALLVQFSEQLFGLVLIFLQVSSWLMGQGLGQNSGLLAHSTEWTFSDNMTI